MFESLSERLTAVFRSLSGRAQLTEDNIREGLREVRLALLEADVNFKVVKEFTDRVQERCLGQAVEKNLSPTQQLIKVVNEELTELLGGGDAELKLTGAHPGVILLAGLQGSGKTTSAGKLANLLRKQKMRPYLVPADVYRPAAIDQLSALARQLGVPCYPSTSEMKPARLVKDAVAAAKAADCTVVIVDTAGRLHVDDELMRELADIRDSVNPQEILFVADAMTGQDAVTVAEAFNTQLGITGVILTKMDGDARGGAALSIKSVTGAPVKFVGVGEKLSEMEVFHPDRAAGRILGMGDMLTLIEKAQSAYEAEEAEALNRKLRKATFDFDDFRTQMRRVRKIGSFESLMKLIPGMGGIAAKISEAGGLPEKEMSRTEAIINSMTAQERHHPDIINASRRVRIARGSGTSVAQVNQLLRQFSQMRQMMQRVMGGKNMPAMPKMPGGFPGMGGGFPGMGGGFAGMGGGFPGLPSMPGGGHSSTKKKRDKAKERAKRKNKKR